jgi:hypothetical protein
MQTNGVETKAISPEEAIVASNGLIDCGEQQSKMDIKDYIHLYIGCKVSREHKADRSEKFSEYGKLVGVSASEVEPGRIVAIIDVGLDHQHEWYVEETILNLRPLSSMTEEEQIELYNLIWPNDTRFTDNGKLEHINWMLDLPGEFAPHEDIQLRVEVIGIIKRAIVIKHLLSKGFDLFNLIENNLAISSHA